MATRKANTAKKAEEAKATAEAKKAEEAKTDAKAPQDTANETPSDAVIARVLERFRDKETGSVFQPGSIVVVSPERFEEICSAGDFLERA